jgi:hypothetical protein
MYPNPNKVDVPDIIALRKHLLLEGKIGRAELIKLIKDVTVLFNRE